MRPVFLPDPTRAARIAFAVLLAVGALSWLVIAIGVGLLAFTLNSYGYAVLHWLNWR